MDFNSKEDKKMNYKVNDRVKVREDLEYGETYGGIYCFGNMLLLSGDIVTIKEITNEGYYELFENFYTLSEEMFSGLADEPTQTEPNRLEIASRIMAALIMANYKWSPSDMAKESLKHTDALITELNKPKP